jgi:hypothetical protein
MHKCHILTEEKLDHSGVLLEQIFRFVDSSRQSVKSFRSHSNKTENYTHTKLEVYMHYFLQTEQQVLVANRFFDTEWVLL